MTERQPNPSPPDESRSFIPWPEQNADGVDLSLIRRNLMLTPTERIRRADRFARDSERLRSRMSPRERRIFEQLKKAW